MSVDNCKALFRSAEVLKYLKLTSDEVEVVLSFISFLELEKGGLVFSFGDASDNLFVLLSGSVA